ncbi:hypothetical protein [Nesterenkonia haasae]|uniref:hypothetical protein n=1 Tax=Nesterenkonia haasae TaxID=2587813 RepID=UPI0013909219|nr:hypothetical protein [Nesterenkonia haasae]
MSVTPGILQARQRLKAARLEDHVRKAVQAAPPLTEQQLDAIALHLNRAKAVKGR